MLPDLHMHTCYSHDGAPHSTVDALCQRAIELGLPAIAITDHFDINRELAATNVRTLPRDLIYRDVLAAREKYGDRLLVLHGVELGQAIAHPERSVELIGELPYDIVLGSLHSIPGTKGFSHIDFTCVPKESYNAYFAGVLDHTLELLDLGIIHVVAHLTYIHRYLHKVGKTLDFPRFADGMTALFKKMISLGVALEINTSTADDGITMPTREILLLYRDCGGRLLTIGSDAHKPENMAKGFAKTKEMIASCGYTSLDVPTASGILSFPL